ncbi:protein FIP1-like isoform X2 [Cynara cardunculus var. scolymus]|uniref:protein FIP1-like isoform X2 n=1 Tax=Cynara cardunculus var. scolymus TaxID=59895 RepID=UPI000D62A109|nr:protein FIP1-like isoform X2 [Cynara cardunculus var. scolymus]
MSSQTLKQFQLVYCLFLPFWRLVFHKYHCTCRHLPAIYGLSSPENKIAGLLYFQSKDEAYYSPTLCQYVIWHRGDATYHGLGAIYKNSSNSYDSQLLQIFRIIMVVEAIFAASFMSIYIGNVHQYNTLESQPDVLKSLYSPLQPPSSLEALRYHDGGRLSDQQMALLQYQRDNLNFLSEEILRLQECLSKFERSGDGTAPQVDLAHLLAARDQELRTLSAEVIRMSRSIFIPSPYQVNAYESLGRKI